MSTHERNGSRYSDHDAEYQTAPDELFIVVRPGRPMYIRVTPGDHVQEGDAFHRERMGETRHLPTWEVTEITPSHVLGREVGSDDEKRWDREELERGLVVGRYSTDLTDFERISVIQTGRWSEYDESPEQTGTRYNGRPYVTVVAYGDNGERYGRRYRFVEGTEDHLELWTQDAAIDRFRDGVRARLDERARAELAADGYTLRET
jgi:hypothetical protein